MARVIIANTFKKIEGGGEDFGSSDVLIGGKEVAINHIFREARGAFPRSMLIYNGIKWVGIKYGDLIGSDETSCSYVDQPDVMSAIMADTGECEVTMV